MLKQEKLGGGVGEFSAALYFSALRINGCNPLICDGAVYAEVGKASSVRKWAAAYDPDGATRLAYVRAVWATRAPGTRMIELG